MTADRPALQTGKLARVQVKANFTPPEISAMEDFIGRSDRSVSPVIRRAWELGATNDAWWQGHEAAYECWGKAIEEKGLSWKFRAASGE